ncbi:5845_t:CDS:2 [Scutellospora calospora]|uniref:5845_t:CDS:1 n=1 Tax=Scutellospora calospora TaxID=85575 RepID=A0ACA9KKC9_9GLOM|nr:5845_t:CDS:2 [Scutellospora calospora]
MSSIMNDEYRNLQELYDAILNTLFPILLIKFIDLQWKKNEKMMERTFLELKNKEKEIINKTVQGIQNAADKDKLEEEYEKAKTSELYKQDESKTIIDNLYKRKNVYFGIDKSLSISEKNKRILKDALVKLIPNTIEDGDEYDELVGFEIMLKECKKEILDKKEIFVIEDDDDNNEDFEIKSEECKKEILKILNEILKEINKERNAYFKISRVSTFRAIALPLLDDALYNIVTWIIPLVASLVYDELFKIKIFSYVNMVVHLTFSIITIFSKFLAKKFKSNYYGYNIITAGDKGFCWTFKIINKIEFDDSNCIAVAAMNLIIFPVYVIPLFWIIVITEQPFDLISFVFLILFALLLLQSFCIVIFLRFATLMAQYTLKKMISRSREKDKEKTKKIKEKDKEKTKEIKKKNNEKGITMKWDGIQIPDIVFSIVSKNRLIKEIRVLQIGKGNKEKRQLM